MRKPSILLLALVTLALPLGAWESQLFPFNAGTGKYEIQTVNFNGRNWRLPDYSYVGYKLGAQPLASGLPCNVVTIAGAGNITTELQNAVNSLAATGGTVRIPAGSFTVDSTIRILSNNISIEGAGALATSIQVPATYNPGDDRYEGVFCFGKATPANGNGRWFTDGALITTVNSAIAENDLVLNVASSAAINVGDWVVVQQQFWTAFVNENLANGYWATTPFNPLPNGGYYTFSYLRQVLAKTAGSITVDAPMPYGLNPANNTIHVRSATVAGYPLYQNVGIAGLSIRFANNTSNGSYAPPRPSGVGIFFNGVRDGWVYDVHLHNVPRDGVLMQAAARISVVDTHVRGSQDQGGDGFGYAFQSMASQNILYLRSVSEDVRHGFIPQYAVSNQIVVSDCQTKWVRLTEDTHHSFVHGLLHDNFKQLNGAAAVEHFYRGPTSAGAHETWGNGTYWNFYGDSHGGNYHGGEMIMKPSPSQGTYALVIQGPALHECYEGQQGSGPYVNLSQILPNPGLQVGPAAGASGQRVLWEGLGRTGLQPEAIYPVMLANRLGSLPAAWAGACGSPAYSPVAPPYSVTPEPIGQLVYNGDMPAWHASGGGQCPQDAYGNYSNCLRSNTAQNHTSGGSKSYYISHTGNDPWSWWAFLGGPNMNASNVTQLRMWIRPNTNALEFRIRFHQDQPINNLVYGGHVDVTAAHVVGGGGWVANAWNEVRVPVTGTFNFDTFIMAPAPSGINTPFYLDDFYLIGNVTTPTSTVTAGAGASPSSTRTPSVTASRTPSTTATRTPSATGTRTPSATATPSPSPSATASPGLLNIGPPASGRGYYCAAVDSIQTYTYGRFEGVFQSMPGSALVSALFPYRNTAGNDHNEIDFENLGRYNDNTQLNVFSYNNVDHPTSHTLCFNPHTSFHHYAIEWEPGEIRWLVDGVEIRVDNSAYVAAEMNLPVEFRLNAWLSDIVGWVGPIDDNAYPANMFYDWVAYSAYTPGAGPGGSDFTQQWRDDFNTFDSARWTKGAYTWPGNAGEMTPYNVNVSNGLLVLSVTKAPYAGFAGLAPTAMSTPNNYCGTPAATATPYAGTPTPSPSATPQPCVVSFDNFESGSLNGGFGAADTANGATCSFANSAAAAQSGLRGGLITYNSGPAAAWGCVAGLQASSGAPFNTVNPVALGAWLRGPAGLQVALEIGESNVNGGDGENWDSPSFSLPDGNWHFYSIPSSSFFRLNGSGDNNFDLQSVQQFVVRIFSNQGSGTLHVDGIVVDRGCASPSPSPSTTLTHTPSATPSASPSATRTATGTASSTATVTATVTSTVTPSASPTGSPTVSPSSTASATAGGPTRTVTLSYTVNPSGTASYTALPTAIPTMTVTATPLPLSPTATRTPTALMATATPSPMLTSTAPVGTGTLTILKAQAQPNPNPSAFSVKLDGPADEIQVKIYSVAEVLVAQSTQGPAHSGWNKVSLPLGWSQGLANGAYYARLRARRGEVYSPAVLVKISVLR